QEASEFGGAGYLTGTLQPDDEHHRRRLVREAQPGGMAAEHLSQLVADDFDNLLAGRERSENVFAHRLIFNLLNELLDNFEVNVGLKQRYADFTERLLHVGGGQLPFPAQIFKDA